LLLLLTGFLQLLLTLRPWDNLATEHNIKISHTQHTRICNCLRSTYGSYEIVGIYVIYLHTKLHMSISSGSLVTVIKPTAYRFHAVAVFYNAQN
jgi:hypothetical protein